VLELPGGKCSAKGCDREGGWLCVRTMTPGRCGIGANACLLHAQQWAERLGVEIPLSQEGEIGPQS
jgi:hypothetical protein